MTDRFSPLARAYAAFRPAYPASFIAALAALAPGRTLAWDCATGNGQAALQLAEHFDRVLATDLSRDQLSLAAFHPRVTYRAAGEEAPGAAAGSVDLVSVAQALHWLDTPRFFGNVRRVLKPAGVIAVWCYGRVEIAPAIDAVMDRFEATLHRFRAPELELMRGGYRGVDLPFAEIAAGEWSMSERMTREQFLGFVGSWSAVGAARAETQRDPLEELGAALRARWADREPRLVSWPIAVRAGRA